MAASKIQAIWNHPAGPKTIHFWAPAFKWGITFANIYDFWEPAEKLSYAQQTAVAVSGIIWARNSTQISPETSTTPYLVAGMLGMFKKNWTLLSVSVGMAATGMYQLGRKLQHDVLLKHEATMAEG